jgi:hypothetical protein
MTNEYQEFDRLVTSVLKVPHKDIKAKLAKEKQAKKRKKSKKSAALDRASSERA